MKSTPQIRLLLVDDHKILRDGLKQAIEKENDMQVIADARDGRTALQLAIDLVPDVVIMDISMPELNGIEATRQILNHHPKIKIIALSMHAERQYVMGMLKAGARGYILKTNAFDELAVAIRNVMQNNSYVSSEITGIVIDSALGTEDDASQLESLSSREKEVLQLIAEGKNSAYMAENMHISKKTVELHRQNLRKKLNLSSVAELTRYAIKHGVISL